ncbi:ABC transporter permease [Clostridium oryzae]|uniref:ABC-2 family transporter protein n=1 Tax=Clostridium oryzae TaxID=1450648 RepID=A0A1V4I766_9CLOT|nr:ABC transporter permease [Clostridium oryzae]OPJ55720.1 ABC-2 family transporter protein [Clostridium oryzae]
MKFLNMVLVNCKRYLRNRSTVVLALIMPLVCLVMVTKFIGSSRSANYDNIGIVCQNKDRYSKEIINKLRPVKVFNGKTEAINELKNYNVIAVYEFGKTFSQDIEAGRKPKVHCYKIKTGNATSTFDIDLNNSINKLLKRQILINNGIKESTKEEDSSIINIKYIIKDRFIPSGVYMAVMLIMYFLMMHSLTISKDILNLKNKKILERFLTTGNKGYSIMASIYISMLIVQSSLYSLSFILINIINKNNFGNMLIFIINVICMNMISIAVGILLSRIFNNDSTATMAGILFVIIIFAVYMGGLLNSSSNSVIFNVSKLTPFYWTMDSIEKSKLFPNVFVLILMATAYFTAGSIRYSSFAKE